MRVGGGGGGGGGSSVGEDGEGRGGLVVIKIMRLPTAM